MYKPRKNETQKQISNFSIYFENKRIRESATFCFRPSGSFYIYNRKEIRQDKFEATYPVDLILKSNGKGDPVSSSKV